MEMPDQKPADGDKEEQKVDKTTTVSSGTISPAEWADITNTNDPEGDRMLRSDNPNLQDYTKQ